MKRFSQTVKVLLALFVAVFSNGLTPALASAFVVPSDDTVYALTDKVDICHATAEGRWNSPNTTVAGILHTEGEPGQAGHTNHPGDIIPPFKYTDSSDQTVAYTGKNWDPNTQAIYENGCKIPVAPVVTPLPSGIADVCGKGNDTVPLAGEHYTVLADSQWVADGDGLVKTVRTITYQTIDGYVFNTTPVSGWAFNAEGTQATYRYTDWGTPCLVTIKPCTEWGSTLATNLNPNGWTLSNGASFVDGGLKLSVEDAPTPDNWNTATATRALTGSLRDLGTDIAFTPTTKYLGLHIQTSKGTLVYEYEPSYGGKWWSESDFGVASGMGYATFDTLENIVAKNPDVTLQSLTILYTSPVTANTTVTLISVGCVHYTFDYVEKPRVPVKPCTVWDSNLSTNLNHNGWKFYSNNTAYVAGGMKFTIAEPWAQEYISRDITGMTLADIGTGVDFTATNAPYVGLHVETVDGRWLTYEKGPGYNNNWWSWDSFNVASGMGYTTFDSLENIVAANPDVQLANLFVLYTNKVAATSTVTEVKFGCTTYTFDYVAPTVPVTQEPHVLGIVAPQTLGTATAAQLPAELPATGGTPTESNLMLLLGVVLSGMTYYIALRRQTQTA